jgi:predicted ATPase/DNA-binding SARP family transcriptional activator
VEFRVLGALEVVDGGAASAPAGAKERTILARLLLERGGLVSADALLEAAWPDASPESAARSLQVRLAHLRSFLEPGRPRGAPSSLIVREGTGYRLAAEAESIDVVRFERLVLEAGELGPAAAVAAYDEALALWRGPPFADVAYADFAQAEVRRLEDLRVRAEEGRARALLEGGRHREALADLRRLVAEEPLREDGARTLALALYRDGRQAEALESLRALGEKLRALGLDPGQETRELERRILVHDPELAAPAPVRTPRGAAPRLPSRASRFFGREAQLGQAAKLVEDHQLVTLTGVGGAGKTRLALELARTLAERFPDGPRWCELAPARSDADVPGAVAEALGVESMAGAGLDRALEHLGTRDGLLVLDNCEHVRDGAADLVERLLEAGSRLRVVATSRAPLGVDGEQVLRLSGLELPAGAAAPDAAAAAAVALFLDRSRAAGAAVDPVADLAAIGELCRRLDGLPLAIELAAGRTRSLTPGEIAARLDERFSLLVVSGRRADPRHSTLAAAISWSYDMLDEPRRLLFERLSVFARACPLGAAEHVCAGEGVQRREVPGLLDDLVAHSLVSAAAARGGMRYGLLETLREYAAERLAERGEDAAARDRHADHYVAEALLMRETGWRERTLPFVDDFDDLRSSVRWTMQADAGPERAFILVEALWWAVHARHAEESAALAEEALERWPGAHALRSRALGAASLARAVCGDPAEALRHAKEALELEQHAAEPALLARRTLAQLAFFGRDPARAAGLLRELAERARAAGFDALACEADGFMVQLRAAAGDSEAATELAREMRGEAARLGSPLLVSWAQYVSGIAHLGADPAEARRRLEQAVALAREADYHHMVRFGLRALGVAATLECEPEDAARHLLAALDHEEASADAASQRTTLTALALLLAREGAQEPAAELLAATRAWPSPPFLAALAEAERHRLAEELGERWAEAARRGEARELASLKALARAGLARHEAVSAR